MMATAALYIPHVITTKQLYIVNFAVTVAHKLPV